MKEKNGYVSKVVRNEDQKFDFILYINGKPIVQRWFDIIGFNKDSLKSLELKEMMDELVGSEGSTGILTEKLKKDSINYLWNTYNPYFVQGQEYVDTLSESENVFRLDIMYNKKAIISSEIPGHYAPIGKFGKKGDIYQVNITSIIFEMISVIRKYLSMHSYTEASTY